MEKKLNMKKWQELVNKSKKIEVSLADLSIVDSKSFKQLRNDLQLSQSRFANILGVTKKTIEKWEQGINPIKGTAKSLVYLIMNDHNIIDRLFKVKITEPNEMKIKRSGVFYLKEIHITEIDNINLKESHYVLLNNDSNLDLEMEKNQWTRSNQPISYPLCS